MIKFRAKTSKILIILSVLLSAVFALTVGYTYSALSISLEVGSNTVSTSTYLAKQSYAVINDSLTSPVLFGEGTKLSEVAVEYSYSYDIDMRIKYSLSWSNGADTSNVILTHPNRDNFIIDSNYIFVRDTISAGTGKLTVISAVNFVDVTDETYSGATLTINVEVSVYKADSSTSYTPSHALASGISGEAVTAWLKYKSGSSSESDPASAYVIAYNYRYDYTHGVAHPGVQTAYIYDSSSNSYKAQYGNRYYAGVGMYIVTGSSDFYISANVVGSWISNSDTSATSYANLVFENNIRYNYTSDWAVESKVNDVFNNMKLNFYIPANSAVYINIIDSIEITSLGNLSVSDYTNYKMISKLTINGTSFDTSTNGIVAGEISSVGTNTDDTNTDDTNTDDTNTDTKYSQSTLEVSNSGVYSPYLYNLTSGAALSSIPTSILVTNNTANNVSLSTISMNLNAVFSNGLTSLSENGGNGWIRQDYTSSNYSVTTKAYGTYVAPYSTIDLVDYFGVGSGLFGELQGKSEISGGACNAWLYLQVSVTLTSSTTSTSNNTNLDVLTTANESTISVYVKNNSNTKVSNITANISLSTYDITYIKQSTEPSDWSYLYWKYYYESNGKYVQNTSSTFSANTYYSKSVVTTSISTTNATTYNGFTANGSSFTSSSLTLLPGESALVMTISSSKTTVVDTSSSTSASGSSYSALNSIEIVNEGTANAFIVNNSTSSYYVRFTGTLSGTNSKFTTISGYNYYIGIVRPGQVISLSMSAGNNITLDTVTDTGKYSSSTLAEWGTDVVTLFDNYFKLK